MSVRQDRNLSHRSLAKGLNVTGVNEICQFMSITCNTVLGPFKGFIIKTYPCTPLTEYCVLTLYLKRDIMYVCGNMVI